MDEERSYDLYKQLKKHADKAGRTIKDVGDHPVPAIDLEDVLELLLDAVFDVATDTQDRLRTELSDWLSVDGRLTYDDFNRFFPNLPGADRLTLLQKATVFESIQDKTDAEQKDNRVKVDPNKFAMFCWAHGVFPDPAKFERKPAKVDSPKKHHAFPTLDGLFEDDASHHAAASGSG